MTPDNKGAHRPALHDAPDSITPMTIQPSVTDPVMQKAEAALTLLKRAMGSRTHGDYVVLYADGVDGIDAVIRALMDERDTALRMKKVEEGHVLSLEARIESLEAERDRLRRLVKDVLGESWLEATEK